MKLIRLFISSVQKELELERAAVAALVSTDPFLLQHCVPVLFEKEPPPPRPATKPYLDALTACHAYVLMIANEYGTADGDLSATHQEYRTAQELELPTVVLLKGTKDVARTKETRALIDEIKKDGFTYKRFHDREDLRPTMLDALRRMLAESFDIQATSGEVDESAHQIEAASPFETTIIREVSTLALDEELLGHFNHVIATNTAENIFRSGGEALHSRGLAVSGGADDYFHPTTAAFILFAPKPAGRFPQCEILADAYDGSTAGGYPKGQLVINAALPHALEQALEFIDGHTFHPHRVVGLNNVRLDEYPTAALREALVNAVAHRNYEDAARKIFLRVFSDRIEIASPGYPLKPLTPARLRKGGYRPCSRNPMIAQTLATLSLMEQRGTGFARMRDAMLDHGLEEPQIAQQDGFFVVTLPGPAGNFDRIRTPENVGGLVTPAVEAQLNERQKRIMAHVLATGAVTRGWCVAEFKVANDTAGRDLRALTELGLLESQGKARAVRYVTRTAENRPTKS
jgi:predicted HTH transcriptional regulator